MSSINEHDALKKMIKHLKEKNNRLTKQIESRLSYSHTFALEMNMLQKHMNTTDAIGKRFFRKAREDVLEKFVTHQLNEMCRDDDIEE